VIVIVAVGPALDMTYALDELRVGQTNRPHTITRSPGGKGINVARALTTLGIEHQLLCILGGATGRSIRRGMIDEGIKATVVDGSEPTRLTMSVTDLSTATTTDVSEHPTQVSDAEWQALCAGVDETMTAHRPGWLVISGTFPPHLQHDIGGNLVRLGQKRGWRVAVDTNGPYLPATAEARPDIVKVNIHEADALARRQRASNAESPATEQRDSMFVITDGANGARGGGWHVNTPADGTYPVGSGDSFLAGLIAALDRGDSFDEALRLAVGAAGANTEYQGAARFDRARALELADAATLTPLDDPAVDRRNVNP
jgi:1-phosphofructokinase family hexose kinase